ncbi:hypothetical protein EDC18_10257 [Natranaerovirga pectinivora]|uniref:ABC3 transporter permease C-terminal domain-containing protein n=1 Tax=Natranaerovirga pectinivora TaxID=682400 RepID=A0A4R3MM87_9FIRM|nr:FtsX-like permease family protein [Natranaerovirga pectinivora]TCT16043.1 hypothetical protein EDC18_10257 [Natranaerovirga pectinivora]
MKKTLKPMTYLKNNKKRAMILIISFAIFITLIYGLRFFVNPMKYTLENIVLGKSNHMQGVFINRNDILSMDISLWDTDSTSTVLERITEVNRGVKEFGEQLALNEHIDYVIPFSSYHINIHTLISSASYYIPLVEKEQVNTICDYLNITLKEGAMPKEPGEIIVDERMAANWNLKIGDSINNDNTKISGIVKSDFYFAVGIHFDEGFIKRNLLFLNDGYLLNLQDYFYNLGYSASYFNNDDAIRILWDMEGGKQEVNKHFGDLDPVLRLVSLITTLIIAGTLFLVYQLHVQDRYEEWCLYRSLGFSQRDIYLLAAKEFIFCLVTAILLAIVLCFFLINVGGLFMDSRGIVYRFWMPEVFGQIIAALLFLAGILHIPVISGMQEIKTIDGLDDDF